MRTRNAIVIVFLATTLIACAPRSPAPISDTDIAAVRAIQEAYAESLLAGDWDAWGKTFTADVVLMPPNMEPLIGRDAAVAHGRGFPKFNNFTTTVSEVTGIGDLAYTRGTYAYAVTFPDGTAEADSGSFLSVFRRQPDGAWLYSRAIWHSDAPATAPPTGDR